MCQRLDCCPFMCQPGCSVPNTAQDPTGTADIREELEAFWASLPRMETALSAALCMDGMLDDTSDLMGTVCSSW